MLLRSTQVTPSLRMLRDLISFLYLVVACFGLGLMVNVSCEPQMPCVFIFGDSMSDSGNNNGLPTKAKANYKPYGIDFPGGNPTGRFTNGRTYADVITDLLGFNKYIPPFNNNMGDEAKQGVNYASGSAGILPETGSRLGTNIPFKQQMENHKAILSKIGQDDAWKCLYIVNIGTNDYLNNYFADGYDTRNTYSDYHKYAEYLGSQYSEQVKALYNLGARKVALFGVSQAGCALFEIVKSGGKSCNGDVNTAVGYFNEKVVSLVNELNTWRDAKFVYVDSSKVQFTPDQGFKVFDAPCCKVGSDGQCVANTEPCSNRKEYVFWDLFHPTEAVNYVTGNLAYKDISKIVAS